MASWRDSASPQVQDDLDGLLNAALPFAQQMLGESGEFFPFGVVLSSGGDIRMIAADTGHDDKPRSTDVLATRVRGVRVDREALRAVALVSDVRTDDTDAVQVELEHREGADAGCSAAVQKEATRKAVEYGGLAASVASPTIWQ